MRIGVAQLNSTVGDLQGNLALALDAYEQLVGQGADGPGQDWDGASRGQHGARRRKEA